MSYEILDWVEHPEGSLAIGKPDHLKDFEMTVLEVMSPDMTAEEHAMWISRTSLSRLIRPKGFYGRIDGVSVSILDEPLDRLMDARQRGMRFSDEGGRPRENLRTSDASRELADNETRGYVITAESFDPHSRQLGRVQSEAWYTPAPRRTDRNVEYFAPLLRFVTVPQHSQQQREPRVVTPGNNPRPSTIVAPHTWLTDVRGTF